MTTNRLDDNHADRAGTAESCSSHQRESDSGARPPFINEDSRHINSDDVCCIIGDSNMQNSLAKATSEPEASTAPDPSVGEFTAYLKSMGLAKRTIDVYAKSWTRLGRILGRDPVEWTREDCRALLLNDDWGAYSPSSQAIMRSALRRLWELHERDDLLRYHPFWKTKNGTTDRREYIRTHTATPEEMEIVRHHCRDAVLNSDSDHEVYRAFMVLLPPNYGLRAKAISNMRVKDIRLADRELYVYKTKRNKSRTIYMDITIDDLWPRFLKARSNIIHELEKGRHVKDDDGKRVLVPPTDEIRKNLEKLHTPNGWLFFTRTQSKTGSYGEKLTPDSVSSLTGSVTVPLVDKRAHAFRHGKIFELLDDGWKIEKVASYVGHDNIQTTFDYVALGPDEHRKEAERTNGNRRQPVEQAASPEPETAPTGPDTSAVAHLKALHDRGILTTDEYLRKIEAIHGLG